MSNGITLALDAMGGDRGPAEIIRGADLALRRGVAARFLVFGDVRQLEPALAKASALRAACELRHANKTVSMDEKPSQALRRGRDSSMWAAISAVKAGEASAVVSAGNTGALMAMARLQFRMIAGVDRPAIAALWPRREGRAVVLDVGANVAAEEKQLVDFAIMGEAFFRAMTGSEKPAVGLLNVGSEELKGHSIIRSAAEILRVADPEMNFRGFVEGDDIGSESVDVVVTDGFTGNIALKTAEGTARLVAGFMREAFTRSWFSKLGALAMAPSLKALRRQMDPNRVNGGVFLGLKGVVVKSHGGSEAAGVASAIAMAADLARSHFMEEIETNVARVMSGMKALNQTTEESAQALKQKAAVS